MAKKSVTNLPNLDFEPLFDQEGMRQGEDRMNGSGDVAVCRRLTLAVLTRTKDELIAGWKKEGMDEAMFSMIDSVKAFIDHSKQTVEFAECALARLLMTGQIVHPAKAKRHG